MGVNLSEKRKTLTPWGLEVKKRLLERKFARVPPFTQDEIIQHLNGLGFLTNKANFSLLLRGIGAKKRAAEVKAVNDLLRIDMSES